MPLPLLIIFILWMWFMPYFAQGAMDHLAKDNNPATDLQIKLTALMFGLGWPIFCMIGIIKHLTDWVKKD